MLVSTFQGESTMNQRGCPVCLDGTISRYWSSWATSRKPFQRWTLASSRCAKSIKVTLGAKMLLKIRGNCSWWYHLLWDSNGFKRIRKDVKSKCQIFYGFEPSLNSLSMGGAAHIHVGHFFSWHFGVDNLFLQGRLPASRDSTETNGLVPQVTSLSLLDNWIIWCIHWQSTPAKN